MTATGQVDSTQPPARQRTAPRARIALVHDWLTGMRGGEKVLEALCELYPQAHVFTLVHVPGTVSPRIESQLITRSWLSRLPGSSSHYRAMLPLFPFTVEQFDLDRFDLVISSSHCAVKSVVVPGRARHLCYCHTPMRYAWDQFQTYFGIERVGRWRHAVIRPIIRRLARWDAATAHRVDRYVANSQYVARRIREYYNRRASVVHPPVDTEFFCPDTMVSGEGALVVSALVPYKRVDLAIEACRLARVPLTVVGSGPDLGRLQRTAGPDVRFTGSLSDEGVRAAYRAARVVLLPGIEDFGIVPVEAQACGRPVVALGCGGAVETVADGLTGVLVRGRGPAALADGVAKALATRFDEQVIRRNAEQFGRARFAADIDAEVEALLSAAADDVRC